VIYYFMFGRKNKEGVNLDLPKGQGGGEVQPPDNLDIGDILTAKKKTFFMNRPGEPDTNQKTYLEGDTIGDYTGTTETVNGNLFLQVSTIGPQAELAPGTLGWVSAKRVRITNPPEIAFA